MRVIRHIPAHASKDPLGRLLTYCGRDVPAERCIDVRHDCIEDAECKTCQRSDDRRTIEAHRREVREELEPGGDGR